MDAQALLLESLDSRWDHYRGQLKACRRELSEAAVHDLRVATRRLLALADLVRAVAPHPGVRKIRAQLKAHLDRFDTLRDTQVMLDEIARHPALLPALAPFRQHLQKRERRLLGEARALIEKRHPGGLSRRLKHVRGRIKKLDADLQARLLRAADKRCRTVLRRQQRIDPAQPATLHRVRIAFKRLRYTIEIIHPLVPAFPEARLTQMQAYQTALGEIQNADVFQRTLARFAERRGSKSPRAVLRHYERRRARLIAAHLKNKGKLFTFWRPQPDHPFPCEAPT